MPTAALDFIDKLFKDNVFAIAIFFAQSIDCLDCEVLHFSCSIIPWSVDHSFHNCDSLYLRYKPWGSISFFRILHIFISSHFALLSAVGHPSHISILNFHCGRLRIAFFWTFFQIFSTIRFEFNFNFNSCRFIWNQFALLQLELQSFSTWARLHLVKQSCWYSIWRLIGQLTMQGPGFGLDNHPDPLPPPSIPPPRTPPCPPGLSRLGNSTVEPVTAKAWRWCNKTTEAFFKLLLLPAHWGDLLCATTPNVTIPQWLETGGSARASCQHLFRSLTSVDFQLHYLSCQVVENFRWI